MTTAIMKIIKVQKRKKVNGTGTWILFNILGYTFVIIVALLCLTPFIMLISGSFTSEQAITNYGYGILPRDFNTSAYQLLFKYPEDLIRAYGVTVFITAVGTGVGLFVTSMAAYVLSRRDFRYRNQMAFFFYFTTLFSGGMVAIYIFFIRYLYLKDSFLSLILPLMINVFYLLIMRNFISTIPASISESAKIDGANDFVIFTRLILPLSKASLATIGLFLALDYWNDWYNAMLYLTDFKKYPLQYLLYNMLSQSEAMNRVSAASNIAKSSLPTQSLKLAMSVIATGPIILVYPFVQKYFVKGITIGSVKG